ncbi:RNA-guided endonuclease InsQ/TnpB family protein [Streptomyces sporangiiformans]|uniref:IS200/IS605 family element transposase accessory protein TnpB n=1 Tax=Streptomyces sporangiiformans TaxID=2315329 RepID=A0A505DBK3_9ACTN|nr:RNA-guided endonuclease TnpB family protein [Streptomyces sporangiiformans]TPQ21144.1 IS200/IS605 family element transposase accessory protein TnpB [Streptomyces sporangiiformans]
MKLVIRVKLLPTPQQASALKATLHACNEAANHASHHAFTTGIKRNRELRAQIYTQLKDRWGLGAQAAQHVIKKTCDAYTALAANVRAGALGRPNSRRRTKATGKPITFRPDAAQPYDDRMLSWQTEHRTVSIWTVEGRMKRLAYTGHEDQLLLLARRRQGESDLLQQNGQWYLLATIDVPEPPENPAPHGFIGVDLGIENIATTSSGRRHSGRPVNRARENDRRLQRDLAKKNTRSAKRRAKCNAGKQARRTRDINHKISKHIVAEAQRTGRGIALEDLGGIRERARLKKPQRVTLNSWAFGQLGSFIAYKARKAGVPVVYVSPAYTSQECSQCHHIDKRNRPRQAVFACRSCGFVEHADLNASHVIGQRGWWVWVCGAGSQVPVLTLVA